MSVLAPSAAAFTELPTRLKEENAAMRERIAAERRRRGERDGAEERGGVAPEVPG
ncbi:hypothetical protein INR49_028554 [Caranx melampygus]|nr:hypothetical protein INR49_028554 [Caranx melampygus]